jgi:hypothetical protein
MSKIFDSLINKEAYVEAFDDDGEYEGWRSGCRRDTPYDVQRGSC